MNRIVPCLALVLTLSACGGSKPTATNVSLTAPTASAVVIGRPAKSRTTVTFEGNKSVSPDELLAVMTVADADAGPLDEAMLQRDCLMLASNYFDRGYLDNEIHEPVVEKLPDGSARIRIRITEGHRYRIGTITIDEVDAKGASMTPLGGKTLRDRLTPRDGDWFNRSVLARDLTALRRFYADEGYAAVVADPAVAVDHEHDTINVDVHVERGARIVIDHS
ncbi:hypothetical protein BH09MYX1_BH09MYX1_02140 [soil metagenome]